MKQPLNLNALSSDLVTPVPTGMDKAKSTLLLTGQGSRVGVKVIITPVCVFCQPNFTTIRFCWTFV